MTDNLNLSKETSLDKKSIADKIVNIYFLILIAGFVAILNYLFVQELSPNTVASNIVSLVCSFILLITVYYKGEDTFTSYKWLNFITIIIFILFNIIFAMVMLYSSPDNIVYSNESSVFVFSALLSSSALFTLIKKDVKLFKTTMTLLYFIVTGIFPLMFVLIFTYSNPDGIARPMNSAIVFLGITLFSFFGLKSLKNFQYKIFKKFYIALSIMLSLYILEFALSIIGHLQQPYSSSIPLTVGLLVLCILLNIYSVRELILRKSAKTNITESLNLGESPIEEEEIIRSENKIILFFKKLFFGVLWSIAIFMLISTIKLVTVVSSVMLTSDLELNKQTYKEAQDSSYDTSYSQNYEFARKYGVIVFFGSLAIGFGGSFMRVLPGTRRRK